MNAYKDLIGKKCNRLTVVGHATKPLNTKYADKFWLCRCDCGRTTKLSSRRITSGHTKSCGCLKKPNLVGNHYGCYTVIAQGNRPKGVVNRDNYWLCRCDCGKKRHVNANHLKHTTPKHCKKCSNKKVIV